MFSFGRKPFQLDILTAIKHGTFNEIYSTAVPYKLENNIEIKVIHMNQLIALKKALGRFRDLNDIEELTNKNE